MVLWTRSQPLHSGSAEGPGFQDGLGDPSLPLRVDKTVTEWHMQDVTECSQNCGSEWPLGCSAQGWGLSCLKGLRISSRMNK